MSIDSPALQVRIDADEPTGGVVYRDPGSIHMLTNVGGTAYLVRLVELK